MLTDLRSKTTGLTGSRLGKPNPELMAKLATGTPLNGRDIKRLGARMSVENEYGRMNLSQAMNAQRLSGLRNSAGGNSVHPMHIPQPNMNLSGQLSDSFDLNAQKRMKDANAIKIGSLSGEYGDASFGQALNRDLAENSRSISQANLGLARAKRERQIIENEYAHDLELERINEAKRKVQNEELTALSKQWDIANKKVDNAQKQLNYSVAQKAENSGANDAKNQQALAEARSAIDKREKEVLAEQVKSRVILEKIANGGKISNETLSALARVDYKSAVQELASQNPRLQELKSKDGKLVGYLANNGSMTFYIHPNAGEMKSLSVTDIKQLLESGAITKVQANQLYNDMPQVRGLKVNDKASNVILNK